MNPADRAVLVCGLALALTATGALRRAVAFEDPAPGSVSASTVGLPSAPGSLEGLGQAGEVSVFTGQYSYSVPIDLPAGQAGFGPGLTLAYDGGLGNGVVGVGVGMAGVGLVGVGVGPVEPPEVDRNWVAAQPVEPFQVTFE